MLQALTRKFSLSEDVDLTEVSQQCAPQLTGADLYALCADAWMAALKRRIEEREDEEEERRDRQRRGLSTADADRHASGKELVAAGEAAGAGGEAAGVAVTQSDFYVALQNLVPSLSMEELHKYERLRDHYEGKKARK